MKIAIIGLGVIGKIHADVLSMFGTPAGALCDIDDGRIQQAKSRFSPDAVGYHDWKQMLDEYHPDCIHVCTPHDLHAEMIIEALKRDIHVLCEKPLCISKEEINAVLKAEQASKAKLGVCHQNRYNTINLFLKDYLADKKIVGAYGSVAWHRDEEYYQSGNWRGNKKTAGGGVIINQALHTLDLLIWLCGESHSVVAMDGNLTLKNVIEVEDTISLRCFGEVDYFLTATVGAPAVFPVELSFKLENGDHILALPKTVLLNGEVIATEENISALGKDCYGRGHVSLVKDFYECIAQDKPFSLNGAEGAKVIRTILKAYESQGEKLSLEQ